ncbi:hypothetical protein CASFOL_021067 [Castilleja foliolosa]|uniref:Cationic amino acid transporter C-terminal domain-containing protein n=1 Tax=Castilleja foliolosa TaxID=1961234 RepID=A0ABD3CVH4_9LAMI
MTVSKVLIVLFVIVVGAFKVDVSNWTPFAPHGFKSIMTGATVVFFAYVGFDAVANSAEEAKRPQRDLPLGIMGSLLVCVALYVAVCLVITGMVPYGNLGEEAPLAQAFTSKGLKYVSVLISFGAVAGLTTTLLVGIYVQGCILAGLFNMGYSVVSACVVTMRWKAKTSSQVSTRWISNRTEGILYLLAIACCGFAAGVYIDLPGFSCPGVPIVPSISIFVNIFLFAQHGCHDLYLVSEALYVMNTLTQQSAISHSFATWHQPTKFHGPAPGPSRPDSRSHGHVRCGSDGQISFAAGVLFRYDASYFFMIVPSVLAIFSAVALCLRQVYIDLPGFSCPGVPIVPSISIFVNIFLFAQLHYEAWMRFVSFSSVTLAIYTFYGQYHANPVSSNVSIIPK